MSCCVSNKQEECANSIEFLWCRILMQAQSPAHGGTHEILRSANPPIQYHSRLHSAGDSHRSPPACYLSLCVGPLDPACAASAG